MSIKRALDSILEGNLDEMRQNFSSALTTKAVEKLEERKIEIAQNYFGQMQEENQLDELRNFKNEKDVVDYVGKATKQIRDMDAYDLSPEGDKRMKDGEKRTRGMKLLIKKAEKAKKKGMQEEVEQVDEALPMDYWRLSGEKNKTLTTKHLNNAIDRAFAKKNNVDRSQKKTTPKARKKG